MTSDIHSITFDCAHPTRLAAFWAAATGFVPHEPDGLGEVPEHLDHPLLRCLLELFALGEDDAEDDVREWNKHGSRTRKRQGQEDGRKADHLRVPPVLMRDPSADAP